MPKRKLTVPFASGDGEPAFQPSTKIGKKSKLDGKNRSQRRSDRRYLPRRGGIFYSPKVSKSLAGSSKRENERVS
jgi:hypothetical protein